MKRKIWVMSVMTIVVMMNVLCSSSIKAMDGRRDFLTIREAMEIVSYRRNLPLVDKGLSDFVQSTIQKHGYRKEDYLEGVGTCSFWEYVKNGHVVVDTNPDDYFIPDDKQTAAAVAVVDCEGIETIVGDELAISVEMRVFSESSCEVLLREMQDIGFKYKGSANGRKDFVWQTYEVSVFKSSSRGHDYWGVDVRLNKRVYDTTKHVEFKDSTKAHNLCISLDYPVNGNPVLLRRIRTFMMEAIEPDMIYEQPMARFNGDSSDGLALVNYYGRKRCRMLDTGEFSSSPIEITNIEIVGETDYYISFEVFRYGFYGGTSNYRVYGATFRKSDGKRLHVIANPKDPQLMRFLTKDLYIEDRDALLDEYKEHIPLPEYEPYLIQDGVRFVYQQGEIAYRPAGFIRTESAYSVMSPFLTDEVKELLK